MPPLRLPEFSHDFRSDDTVGSNDVDEEVRLASYEEGYAAGWEDAVSAQNDAAMERAAEVARHLQTLAFGYQEARQHVLRALEPLLLQMADRVLPVIARSSLAPILLESALPLAETMADAPIRLRVAPGMSADVEAYLSAQSGLPVLIEEDPALREGQARIECAATEQHIDLDAVTEAVAEAVRAFFETQVMERQNAE